MYVVLIIKEGKELAPKVYGSFSIWVAKQILENHRKFHEKDILKITDEYFEEGYERKKKKNFAPLIKKDATLAGLRNVLKVLSGNW